MKNLSLDCLILIFDELSELNESFIQRINYLYCCLLVNKEWCNIVVPILWKKSSSIYSYEKVEKLFNTILSCLSLSSKQFLTDNDIKLPSIIPLKPPLFNYANFCRFPDYGIISKITTMVFKEELKAGQQISDNKRNLLEQALQKP